MAEIVSFHSFLRGVGKSNLIANLAALLALKGKRVGVLDADLDAPAQHFLFGLKVEAERSLNACLWGECSLEQAARYATPPLGVGGRGMVCVAPASADLAVSVRGLREGYNVNRLHDCALEFVERFRLDVLLVDTHAGVGETSLAAAALSDAALMVLRLDQQGYQGTGVLLELARRLSAPRLGLVVNQMPAHFDPAEVKTQVEQSYQAEVIAVLPHANDLLALGSAGIFVLRHPLHPLTAQLNGLAAWL